MEILYPKKKLAPRVVMLFFITILVNVIDILVSPNCFKTHFFLGRIEEAETEFSKALAIDPSLHSAEYNLGECEFFCHLITKLQDSYTSKISTTWI